MKPVLEMEAPMVADAFAAASDAITLWCMTSAGHTSRCAAVVVPFGIEAQLHVNGRLLCAYRVASFDDIAEWAAIRQARLIEHGWTLTAGATDPVSTGDGAVGTEVTEPSALVRRSVA
jgi:hypothetical protein